MNCLGIALYRPMSRNQRKFKGVYPFRIVVWVSYVAQGGGQDYPDWLTPEQN